MKFHRSRVSLIASLAPTVLLAGLLATRPAGAASVVVGYYTDNNTNDTGPQAAIVAAGYTPVQITNISTFDLSQINLLMLDEENNNTISTALANRLPGIQSWVKAGGKAIVHDRSVGDIANPSPLVLAPPGVVLVRATTTDVNVIPPTNSLVTFGPFGNIDNSSLDGGSYSAHGYATYASLTAGARPILSNGTDTNAVAAFSYALGAGFVYYAGIPLDVYLDNPGITPTAMAAVYAPNVLAYMNSLQPLVVGYYTDDNAGDTSPQAAITQAGFTPLQITDISTFDFSQVSMLMIDEANPFSITGVLTARLPAIQSWVNAGGKVIVHDDSAGHVANPSPLVVGAPGVLLTLVDTSDLNTIAPATTLVTAGPSGTIGDTTLDGGDFSANGYATNSSLPAGARAILSVGANTNEVAAFSYSVGKGFVYYSGIPLEFYLVGGGNLAAMNTIYAPNVLDYVNTLQYVPVGYYTDGNTNDTGPNAAILAAGFTPIQITNITTFDITQLNMLMIDESSSPTISTVLSNRLAAVQSWVNAGGKVMVHDRSAAGGLNPNPLVIGAPGVLITAFINTDLNPMAPTNNLVVAGPFGNIGNTTLDGGSASSHGYASSSSLPPGTRKFLSVGTTNNDVTTFSYPLGRGFVYYSTIPLDFYLDNPTFDAFATNADTIYAPNMLVYNQSLQPIVVGFYTDNNTNSTGPAAPISLVGFSSIAITNITNFDLNQVNMLMLDEEDNFADTAALSASLPTIQAWVKAGGKVIVHDRSAGDAANPDPLVIGAPHVILTRLEGSDVDVIPPGTTLVTAGPYGTIGNTTLDGGHNSEHGYATNTSLPPGALPIICVGGNTNEVVDFTYPLGAGNVYYSTIPADYYLDSITDTIGTNVDTIYIPNVLVYANSLTSGLTLANPTYKAGVFSVSLLHSTPNNVYYLDYKTNATGATWTTISSFVGNGGPLTLVDPAASDAQRFYRARQ